MKMFLGRARKQGKISILIKNAYFVTKFESKYKVTKIKKGNYLSNILKVFKLDKILLILYCFCRILIKVVAN